MAGRLYRSRAFRRLGVIAAGLALMGAAPVDQNANTWTVVLAACGFLLLAAVLVLVRRNRSLRSALAGVRRRYDDAFECMADGLVLFDADGRLVYCNRRYLECFPRTAWLRVPGAQIGELREAAIRYGEFKGVDASSGATWSAAQRAIFNEGGQSEYAFADGRHMIATTRQTPDGGRVVVWHDITARKRLERELEHRATHDNLTGLPNRAMFRDELRRARARAERDSTELAVMLLDLDLFKEVNDTHGHAVGDELLAEVAQRLEGAVRAGDFIARLGGDEFAILAAWPARASQAEGLAHRVLQRISEPFHLGRSLIRPSASIGFAVFPGDSSCAEQLLEHADRALYAAKAAGRGTWASLKAGKIAARGPLMSGERLVSAIERNELDVDYQPILAGGTLEVVGVEALVRWNHPERGRLPARAFLPMAERQPSITALTRCVLGKALTEQRRWDQAGLGEVKIWANLAPRCAASAGLVDAVTSVLEQTGVPPRHLVLELTEAALVGTRSAEANLAALRRLGVAIAIDDFGAGHSSLGRLKAMPVDILKIDRTLISAVAADERDRAVIRTITTLGASLGLATSAEGIETLEQLRVLRRLGCGLVQGYLFARPMAGPELSGWLSAWRSHRRADLEAACRGDAGNVVGWSRPAA